ncbi:MAG: diadenylate cyclase CdaA [Candidatus Latescibacteria bacterium]|nr:diadenylate cyclase CdaA [Candidatus Latescibacterota bacterium]
MLEDIVFLRLFDFVPVTPVSVIDILVVAFVIYRLLNLIRGTRAAQMLVGLFLIVTVALAARWQDMQALAYLLEQVQSILLILLVILFQPELRRMLVALGQSPLLSWFYKTEPNRVIDHVVQGATQLANRGYGALIVLTREAGLESIIETGVPLEARVSADLLTTIFTPRSPLHDQAVVIQGETLVAARCTRPLAEEVEDQRLGTRHRAALGLSQETDAVTIVVSEETQTISITVGGGFLRGLDERELKQRLGELLSPRDASVGGTSALSDD